MPGKVMISTKAVDVSIQAVSAGLSVSCATSVGFVMGAGGGGAGLAAAVAPGAGSAGARDAAATGAAADGAASLAIVWAGAVVWACAPAISANESATTALE
jgi:hypothetical protein